MGPWPYHRGDGHDAPSSLIHTIDYLFLITNIRQDNRMNMILPAALQRLYPDHPVILPKIKGILFIL